MPAVEVIPEPGGVEQLAVEESSGPDGLSAIPRGKAGGYGLLAIGGADHGEDAVGLGGLRPEHLPQDPRGELLALGLLGDEVAEDRMAGEIAA